MQTRIEVLTKFLKNMTLADLSSRYHGGMEVQVNVAQDNGEQTQGEYKGVRWIGYTDGIETWKPFRIPHNAGTEPEYNDVPMSFNSDHIEGVGMTGWNWKEKRSVWVAFDFDAITGHSDKHVAKLTDAQLDEVKNCVNNIPWVEVRRSTSGNGLHLYIYIDPLANVVVNNHTEHASLARAILSMLSGLVGHDLTSKVDACGGNIWVYHRKQKKSENALKVIKPAAELLKRAPDNWQEHMGVIQRKQTKLRNPDASDIIESLTKVKLDSVHKSLIEWLHTNNRQVWWDADNNLLVTHTSSLKQAHTDLKLKGFFETVSRGDDKGDHNCYLYPLYNGGWVVRRYGDVKEHQCWGLNKNGKQYIYFNVIPDVDMIARQFNGIETPKGAYVFSDPKSLADALKSHNLDVSELSEIGTQDVTLSPLANGRVAISIPTSALDSQLKTRGWTCDKKKYMVKVLHLLPTINATDSVDYDNVFRHLVSYSGGDAGWVIRAGDEWRNEPYTNVTLALASSGVKAGDAKEVMGGAVLSAWRLVNMPFQEEYPGGRQWNRNPAKYAAQPSTADNLSFVTWTKMLAHIGSGLDDTIKDDPWCKSVGVLTGKDYLILWLANLMQKPQEPLPYLFLWGAQNAGKSILHEAVSRHLIQNGHVNGASALQSSSNFNAELLGKILATVEEVDLSKRGSDAYNRMKEWVTSPEILLHEKNRTPYMAINTTHWIQVANSRGFCPIFPGDTRVTMVEVRIPGTIIPKTEFHKLLASEASDFLAYLLRIEIPNSRDRLALPALTSAQKIEASYANMTQFELFVRDKQLDHVGYTAAADRVIADYVQWRLLNGEKQLGTTALEREINQLGRFPRGQDRSGHMSYGNLSYDSPEVKLPRVTIVHGVLTNESAPNKE